jgi:hypothetical protein
LSGGPVGGFINHGPSSMGFESGFSGSGLEFGVVVFSVLSSLVVERITNIVLQKQKIQIITYQDFQFKRFALF